MINCALVETADVGDIVHIVGRVKKVENYGGNATRASYYDVYVQDGPGEQVISVRQSEVCKVIKRPIVAGQRIHYEIERRNGVVIALDEDKAWIKLDGDHSHKTVESKFLKHAR